MFQNFIKKFESSEKKIELVFSEKSPSLLELPEQFWRKMVRSCGATVILSAKLPKVHSYILSESSLFVWPRRLLLITCGQTRLSKALLKMLKHFRKEHLEVCFFQRKNEFFPQIQKSCFQKDLQKIKNQIEGRAYRFGSLREHHFFLFHSETDFKPDKRDRTLEVLIYGSEVLKDSSPSSIQPIKQLLERAFVGFEIQDYHFKPYGWSLNAVRGAEYYTVHLSPEESSFYISFETNMRSTGNSTERTTGQATGNSTGQAIDQVAAEKAIKGQETEERTKDQTGDQTKDQTKDQTGDQTGDQTRDQTGEKAINQIGEQTKDQTVDQIGESSEHLSNTIINIFKPIKFDFILFEPEGMEEKAFEPEAYFSSSSFQKTLSCAYTVTYKNFHKVPTRPKSPQLLLSSKR